MATPDIRCSNCDAVCCRLTVVLLPDDKVPAHLTTYNDAGRPTICRQFAMGGPYCQEVRADYADHRARGIALTEY